MNTRFVTSLELSDKLREIGLVQKSQYYWHNYILNKHKLIEGDQGNNLVCSAFTAGELAELLPAELETEDSIYFLEIKKLDTMIGDHFAVAYLNSRALIDLREPNAFHATHDKTYHNTMEKSLAEAMGLMLLKLKEEGFV